MDTNTIVVLALTCLLALSILVIGGLVLSAAAFKQLTDLVARNAELITGVIEHKDPPPVNKGEQQ